MALPIFFVLAKLECKLNIIIYYLLLTIWYL